MKNLKSMWVIFTMILLQLSAFAIQPKSFRIRPNGMNVSQYDFDINKDRRQYLVGEAVAMHKLSSKLEGRAVILARDIRKVRLSYFLQDVLTALSNKYQTQLSKSQAEETAKRHILTSGEEAQLLAALNTLKNDNKAHKVITAFFDGLEFAVDSKTTEEYTTNLKKDSEFRKLLKGRL